MLFETRRHLRSLASGSKESTQEKEGETHPGVFFGTGHFCLAMVTCEPELSKAKVCSLTGCRLPSYFGAISFAQSSGNAGRRLSAAAALALSGEEAVSPMPPLVVTSRGVAVVAVVVAVDKGLVELETRAALAAEASAEEERVGVLARCDWRSLVGVECRELLRADMMVGRRVRARYHQPRQSVGPKARLPAEYKLS